MHNVNYLRFTGYLDLTEQYKYNLCVRIFHTDWHTPFPHFYKESLKIVRKKSKECKQTV